MTKTMTYEHYKQAIKKQIFQELSKKKPDYKLVRELYAKIEDPNKVVDNDEFKEVKETKKYNRVEKKGDDHHRYINIGLQKEEYIELKLKGFSDMRIAQMFGTHDLKIHRLKQSWGLCYHYKKSMVTLETYLELRNNGRTLDEIAVIFKMDRSTLLNRRREWGVVGDKGVNGR